MASLIEVRDMLALQGRMQATQLSARCMLRSRWSMPC